MKKSETGPTEIPSRGMGLREGVHEEKKEGNPYGGGWGKNRGACGNGGLKAWSSFLYFWKP